MAAAQSAAATRRILGEVTVAFFASPLCPLGCNGPVMVRVLRVLVYYPVRETRVSDGVLAGETHVSHPKIVSAKYI